MTVRVVRDERTESGVVTFSHDEIAFPVPWDDELNKAKRGITWNEQQLMAGFVGDVGDLSKIIMAKHGLRSMDDVDTKLAHELSDCLWSILVLARKYNVNLEQEFQNTMDGLDARIDSELAA